jgi:hypothetical protein
MKDFSVKYSHTLWRMLFAITVLINPMHIHTMEVLTESQKLLRAIQDNLPEDVQTLIYKTVALLKMSKFLLAPTRLVNMGSFLKNNPEQPYKRNAFIINENNEAWAVKFYTDTEGYPRMSPTQLLATLAEYTEDYKSPANFYEDKIVMCSQKGSVKIWSRPQGQLLHTLITDTTPAHNILLINHKVVKIITMYKRCVAEIWPLYINFDAPEFNKDGQPFIWKKDNVTIPQADLIARMYDAAQANSFFIIDACTEDIKVFSTFDKNIRLYLEGRLAIKFSEVSHTYNQQTSSGSLCVMQ